MRPKNLTTDETAALIALMHQRSEEKYSFINLKTFYQVAGRKRLAETFKESVINAMYQDYGIHMLLIEDGSGKYALLSLSALHTEKKLLAKRTIPNEFRALKSGDIDFEKIYSELGWDEEWDNDEE